MSSLHNRAVLNFKAPNPLDLCVFPSVLSPALRMAFILLLLISATWLLGLMAVNSNVMTFHYLFAVFSCLQVATCATPHLDPWTPRRFFV